MGSEFQPTMEEVQRSKAIEKMLREEETKLSKEVKVSLSPASLRAPAHRTSDPAYLLNTDITAR